MEEKWDVLDCFGLKTGKVIKKNEKLEQGEYHLVVDSWLLNQNGKYVITKRAFTKIVDPGKWEPTCGSVQRYETSLQAVCREVLEEIGICVDVENLKKYKQIVLLNEGLIIDVWVIRQEIHAEFIKLNDKETIDVRFASSNDIIELIKNQEFIPLNRVPYVFEMLHENMT